MKSKMFGECVSHINQYALFTMLTQTNERVNEMTEVTMRLCLGHTFFQSIYSITGNCKKY